MIPILYDSNEMSFVSNGLGRLRDCISCVVTEERNGIYECDFEYPLNGANYDKIQLGRIIAVKHDDTNDIQPFDIVSCSKPINGVVTFHANHVSYRQSKLTVAGTNINSLADAFTLLGTATPSNPFTYETDMVKTGYLAAANGIPRSVRQMLGGVEGSILDAYGGEYEWDGFTVRLLSARGTQRDLTIRYGVNMLEYNEETDYSNTYTAVIPYWATEEGLVVGSMVDSGEEPFNGWANCIPLDLSEKFETEPTTAQLEAAAASYMISNQTHLPSNSIEIQFVQLQDSNEYAQFAPLLKCELCDWVNVIFPDYKTTGQFKIVKTVYNVLLERYDSLELGKLSTSLAEALGVSQSSGSYSSGGGGGGGSTFFYGTCSTAANVAAKTVTVDNSFVLTAGVRVAVYMTNTNSKANPTLNVNGTGAAAILRYGSTAASTSTASSWNAGQMLCLTYNGTSWFIENWINTTYSSMTQAEMQTGTATTGRLITAARLKEAIQYYAPAGSMNDYVTEQNTSGDWTYRKWNSGVAECWATKTITAATNSSDAGGYVSASAATPSAFPFTFTAVPNVQVTCNSGTITGSVTCAGAPSTTSAGSWKLYRNNTNAGTNDKIFMFYVVGKWK